MEVGFCMLLFLACIIQLVLGRPYPIALPAYSLQSSCQPLLFFFGASMADTGELSAVMPYLSRADYPPYGLDYFSAPAGRWSNGRVFTDFISQELGDGMIHPFLKSANASFTHGANFATAASTARDLDYARLFPLSVQVHQFERLLTELLPTEGYSKKQILEAVFLIETAGNDYDLQFTNSTDFDVAEFIEDVLASMETFLKRLYKLGGRNFVVMSVTPLGCTPAYRLYYPSPEVDEYGCKTYYNSILELHNLRLEDLLTNLTGELPDAKWIFFDAYSIFMDAYHNPTKYGIEHPFDVCCGAGGQYNYVASVTCGMRGYVNGTLVEAKRCEDPSQYVLWDDIHPVETFAKYMADGILTAEYLKPAFNLTNTCSSDA